MKNLLIILLVAFACSMAMAEDSPETPMTGANVVCSAGDGGLLVFDIKNPRMWLAADPFDINADGMQMREVAIRRTVSSFKFSGIFELSWGSKVQINRYTGFVDLRAPSHGQVTMTALSGQAGQQTRSLKCHSVK